MRRVCPYLVGAALLGAPRAASAYCLSTTCKCKSKDTCADDCGMDANGCKTKGAKLHWTGSCVGFSLNKNLTQNIDPEFVRTTVVKAFAAWSDVDCGGGQKASINTAALADATCAKITDYNPDGPNNNLVFFSDNNYVPSDTSDVLAKTVPRFNATTGEIYKADIDVDTSQNEFTTTSTTSSNDLQSVLTHEAGHFLGLDHSSDESAIMYWQYSAGSLNRDLTPDDIAAICELYPPGRAATCSPVPRGGFADTCPTTTSGGCAESPGSSGGRDALIVFGALGAFVVATGRRFARRAARTI